jgi:membrane protease YdiL (CAAX protease family)
VLTFYVLVFVISWGGFLLVGAPGLLGGTNWQTDPRFYFAVTALIAGPPIAGIVMTGLASGRAGMRDLRTRLLRWRVGVSWYAVALLTAPLLEAGVLFGLSSLSPKFLPSIVTANNRASLVLLGVAWGLAGGFLEELGWTGFAIPRLRLRYGVPATGVIVGVPWGVWHLLQMLWVGRTSAETLPLALFLAAYFLLAIATLTAFRMLMVWVYDRTQSLLVAILMHASYIFSTLIALAPPTTGTPYLTYSVTFTAMLWAMVAVVGRGRALRKTSSAVGT